MKRFAEEVNLSISLVVRIHYYFMIVTSTGQSIPIRHLKEGQ
jgi:hypothetical protein